MRIRSSDTRKAINGYEYSYVDISCSSGAGNAGSRLLSFDGQLDTMIDVVSKNYRRRSAAGEVIINPMSRTQLTISSSGDGPGFRSTGVSCTSPVKYGYWYNNGTACNGYWGLTGSNPTVYKAIDAAETSAVVSEAVTDCWASSRQNYGDILVDLAEFDQTARMLLKPFSSVQSYIKTCVSLYTKKYQRRPTSVREAVQGVWLETRYGWRPLLGSIESVSKALLTPELNRRQTSRGSKSFTKTDTKTGVIDFGSGVVNWSCYITETISVRASLLADATTSMRTRLGLDLGGVLSLPWELVPYSFVADWFANVGSFLQGMGAYATGRGLGSCYTQKNVIENVYQCTSTVPISIRTLARSANNTATVKLIQTDRLPVLPPPSVTVKVDVSQMTSLKHAIDAVTLIAQRFR